MAFTNIYCVGSTLSRRTRWLGNVAPIGVKEVHTLFWWGNLRERDHVEDPGIDGRIMLSRFFKMCNGGRAWTGLIWIRIGTGGKFLKMQ
jgi:hypothetical protein